MKVYRVTVRLYEGDDVNLGVFASKAAAEAAKDDAADDWADGPNVESIDITEEDLR